ncbi:MAG: PAS domain-containing protein [Chloroflexi bacterium]|nr:PAS domain-containing protein [Chloroflexota bacterium]
MNNQPNQEELTGVIQRINRLGAASERVFSRLYKGLSGHQGDTQQIRAQNRELQTTLKNRNIEIERLNSILASIDQGVIMQDNEGRLVLVNEAARKLLGNIKAFWQSELGTLFNNYRTFAPIDAELSPLTAPTSVQVNNRILGAQLAAVADEAGNRIGTMIVLRDVTGEALSDRLKDHFITAISHELRTPMAVIKGVSELIAASDALPNRRLLETLSRNVDVLDRMIVELLDISELSDANFSIRNERLNVEELLWNVVNGQTPEIKRAQLDVSVLVRKTQNLFVQGDDQRLRWAFGHLLQNAIHYTEAGGHILITISPNDSDSLAIQFVDTGVGIGDRDLPHVFEQFYRGEARTPGGKLIDPRGLGQGLFVARRVLERHGGHISVSSGRGQGSIFTAVLPITAA